MNRLTARLSPRLLATAVASLVLGAGVALAAPPQAAVGTAQPASPARASRPALDTNRDGVIDRAEAAAHPRLAEQFDRLVSNRDGRLQASERPAWKRRGGAHGGRGMHGGRGHGGMDGMRKLDADGDGRISRAEAAAHAAFAERFAQADRNRDGYLVRSELEALRAQHRAERQAGHKARIEASFAKADANRDGKLSRAEIETGMPRMARAFNYLDENRDGYLTRADLMPRSR